MGFLDALLGKRKVKGPAPDRLFAITTAYVDLEDQQGIKTRGKAAIVFQPLGTSDFQSIVSEMEEVLRLADRILVLREGRIAASFGRAEASESAIMTAAALAGSAAHGQ